jgi:hypothetical protein
MTMRQATIDHSTCVAVRTDGHQDTIGFDLAGGFDHIAVMQDENGSQIVAASDEGNFVILDDTPQRYSGIRAMNSDSDAYLEGCLRILQSIVGQGRRKQIRQAR